MVRRVLIFLGIVILVAIGKACDNSSAPPPRSPEAIKADLAAAAQHQAEVDARMRAREADFARDRLTIIAKAKQLNAAAKYPAVVDIGNDYAWANDKELNAQIDLARDKVAAKAMAAAKLAKKKEGVSVGMSPQDVYDSSWGHPESVNRTTTAFGVHEQWVYPGHHSYLYFQNGVLTSIQN